MKAFLFFIVLLFFNATLLAQLPFQLVDGIEHRFCTSCQQIIQDKPKEVLFGIQINLNGDIYFSMNNKVWFDKIFKNNSYGVSVDLVSKDRYACGSKDNGDASNTLPKGTIIQPVYKNELIRNLEPISSDGIFVKIGKVPARLMGKQIEGNLVIVNGNYICYYSNFVNIDRTVFHLLPMGLFTDSLIHSDNLQSNTTDEFFTYTKRIQVEIPFQKASAHFDRTYLKEINDSLQLTNFRIKKIEVRAYSSIEGPAKLNTEIMKRRADTIIQALTKYQSVKKMVSVITAENWLDFYKDIQDTKYADLQGFSKISIKQKLTDKQVLNELEPTLSKERKAIVTLFLESKTSFSVLADSAIFSGFNTAIKEKNIKKAREIQKELVDRIMDNQLPVTAINKIEVPKSKDYADLLNDREVYKYLLKATTEYEALENFILLRKLDPDNGQINYNICALEFFTWQYGGDTMVSKVILPQINGLAKQGIQDALVKRMIINYHILACEEDMKSYNYSAKDSSLAAIYEIYQHLHLTDEEIFSLAKYFSFYSQQNWAEEIIIPRIDQLNVSEDLVFYYVNLLFYSPSEFDSDRFHTAMINAINLNPSRFCDFFRPNDKGGASMQLLEYENIKKAYCDACGNK